MNGNRLIIQGIAKGSCMHHLATEGKTMCSKCVLKKMFLSSQGMLLSDPGQITACLEKTKKWCMQLPYGIH
jgi:hypothetical protein